jgi:hypothetical protein
MKYAFLLSIMGASGGFYVHDQQPQLWREIVAAVAPPSVAAPAEPSFTPPNPLPAQPNWTWTTRTGRTYNDVVIQKVEADCVTILDRDGGARLIISDLPEDLQKQLNYDERLAAEASARRGDDDQASASYMEQERGQGEQVAQRKLAELGVQQQTNREEEDREGDRRGFDQDGGEVTDQQASGYADDLQEVMRHVRIDPATGRPYGDAYYISKYDEDRRYLAMHDQARLERERHAEGDARSSESNSNGNAGQGASDHHHDFGGTQAQPRKNPPPQSRETPPTPRPAPASVSRPVPPSLPVP